MIGTTNDENKRLSFVSSGRLLFILISVVVIFHHFIFLSNVVTDIPTWDDYDAILRYLNNFAATESLTDRIVLTLKQHNEHRIAETRTLALLQWKLMGTVNFKTLTIIGNCQLIFLLALLAFYYRAKAYSWYSLLPVPFIIFNLNSNANLIWTTTSVTNFGVLLLAMAGIMTLHSKSFTSSRFPLRFWLSLMLTLFATVSGGVGFLSLFICACSLWINRAPKVYCVAWTGIMLVILVLHFGNQDASTNLAGLQLSLSDIGIMISRFIIMIGNYFIIYGPIGYYSVWVMGSVMILGLALYVIVKKLWVTNPTLFCCMAFLFGSSAIIAIGRISEGETQAFASRYVIYSTLITVFLFTLVIEIVSKEKVKYAVTVFLVVNLFLFFQAYIENVPLIRSDRDRLVIGADSYNKDWSTTLSYPDQNVALGLIEKSQALGIYTLPDANSNTLYNAGLVINKTESALSETIQYNIEEIFEGKQFCVVKGWAFIRGTTASPQTFDITFISQGKTYVKTCKVFGRRDVQEYFKDGPKNSGFRLVIFQDEIQAGSYGIGIEIDNAGKKHEAYSGKSITISN